MTTWRYIKGNEKDFEGAPDEATIVTIDNMRRKHFGDVFPVPGAKYWSDLGSKGEWGNGVKSIQFEIIVQREPVESSRWNYIIGTPEMFARMSKDVTHLFRNRLNGVVNGICSPDVIATYSARLDCELIGHRESATNAVPVAINDSKYNRPCKGISIDVYDVLKAFNVTCPALQHLIKKALAVGQRGHKDASEDLKDILASAKRAIELSESNK